MSKDPYPNNMGDDEIDKLKSEVSKAKTAFTDISFELMKVKDSLERVKSDLRAANENITIILQHFKLDIENIPAHKALVSREE